MSILSFLGGVILVEITSASVNESLIHFANANIPISDLDMVNELTARFSVRRKDYAFLQRLCAKRGDDIKIAKRSGLIWMLMALRKRPVLITGLLLASFLMWAMQTFIFFVRVEGNRFTSAQEIISAAEDNGIRWGASRKKVRNEQLKNSLLLSLPQLQWAGINTRGCSAVISVRDANPLQADPNTNCICSIIASKDGVVTSCTATNGSALCTVGQAVRKGDTLVSGYENCGAVVKAVHASGEIFALTQNHISVITPANCLLRSEVSAVKKQISLRIGKKLINLWQGSGIWDGSCGRMYEEKVLTLPGNYALPVALIINQYSFFDQIAGETSTDALQHQLSQFAERRLCQQMIAGNIIKKQENFSRKDGIFILESTCLCNEMIGWHHPEQIGEQYG